MSETFKTSKIGADTRRQITKRIQLFVRDKHRPSIEHTSMLEPAVEVTNTENIIDPEFDGGV